MESYHREVLHHDGKTWSTNCNRCKSSPVQIVGVADTRRSKVGPELTKAAKFLESLGWIPLHRKNAGYSVEWHCAACVAELKARATSRAMFDTSRFDMRPHEKKGA